MFRIVDVSELQGPLTELLQQFQGENGQERFKEFKLWLKKVETKFLCQITEVAVDAVKKFVANDAFGSSDPDGIKFSLWVIFKENFLGKIENDVPAGELVVHTLIRPSQDGPIIDELGDCKEINLAHIYELIKRQANGEIILLTNGHANIFHNIRDVKGNIWVVAVLWESSSRSWQVIVRFVNDPFGWAAGCRVFSRK